MNGYRIRRAILLKIHPEARDYDWLKKLDAHQARMANDPEIQCRRAASRKQERRDLMLNFGVTAALLLPLAYWAAPTLLSLLIEAH